MAEQRFDRGPDHVVALAQAGHVDLVEALVEGNPHLVVEVGPTEREWDRGMTDTEPAGQGQVVGIARHGIDVRQHLVHPPLLGGIQHALHVGIVEAVGAALHPLHHALEDLQGYQAKRREPIRGSYKGYEILSFPPPSSGGIALVEIANILDPFDLAARGAGSSASLHVIAEVVAS